MKKNVLREAQSYSTTITELDFKVTLCADFMNISISFERQTKYVTEKKQRSLRLSRKFFLNV